MKNRILALLLAGLLTATMAACSTSGSQSGGTETGPSITTPKEDDSTTPDPDKEWQTVNKKVYTHKEVTLRDEPSSSGKAVKTLAAALELNCTKVSTAWSYVEYQGAYGYVSNAYITDTNILGTDFEGVPGGEKIMYANAKTITVRLYPSTADFSTEKGSYALNEEVTVIASNGQWYKVKYETKSGTVDYYVHISCLSDEKVIDPDDMTQYEGMFKDAPADTYLFTNCRVNFRKAPNKNASLIETLDAGVEVRVIQTGTVPSGETREWSYVEIKIAPEKEGDATTYKYGYISSDCLSATNPSGEMDLDDLLDLYPMFTEANKTMYIITGEDDGGNSINVRSTPSFPKDGEKSNLLISITSKKTDVASVKIVATGGVYDEATWVIIEYTDDKGTADTSDDKTVYGFITTKYLTTDSTGKEAVTLDSLLIKHPGFEVCQTETTITATKKANCYTAPENGKTPAKTLQSGDEVTLVAVETGSARNVWYVIKDASGNYYFVGMEFFAEN
ncbi:MAG: SH3 domain-containing protein [Clostridia bacterium]|nr:SH3 domain-containing protein [Clostridia bacterium]